MAKAKIVWGIDIGQRALKALKVQKVDDQLQVEAFDIVEHPKILSDPEADSQALVRSALEEFLSRNSVAGATVCVSVPGQSSFTRFVKLPPVEPKKIPDIVRFEAEQQIPFAVADVIWRWQTFHQPDSPDVEVGIFAMKRSDIAEVLDHFSAVGMDVDTVQMAPLALYNFMKYDQQTAPDGATLLADVGAEKTDLVVSDGARIWTRTIQIGGNNFTEALVKAFKLSFSKAEKLKRTAASSKYARQIFQAMRPVFADLVQEIQRSVGYYTSLHRETRFKRLVGLGNGFRLPGLQKFLEQNLNIPVVRIDNYNKLKTSSGVNLPVFTDNVLSFAVAYGLALQGLEEAIVATNLLPTQVARAKQWAQKRPWFAAVAGVAMVILGTHLFRTYFDKSALAVTAGDELSRAQAIVKELKSCKSAYSDWERQGNDEQKLVDDLFKAYEYRDYWPSLLSLISDGIREQARDQNLLTKYALAKTKEEREAALAEISAIKRSERRMVFIEKITPEYQPNVDDPAAVGLRKATGGASEAPPSAAAAGASTGTARRGYLIRITGRTPLPKTAANPFLQSIFVKWQNLGKNYQCLSVVDYCVIDYPGSASTGGGGPRAPGKYMPEDVYGGPPTTPDAGGPARAEAPDPLFPDSPAEDEAKDTRFEIGLVVSIEEPGAAKPQAGGGP